MTLGESARASMARRKLIKARGKPKSGPMILQRQASRMEGNFQLPLDAMALDSLDRFREDNEEDLLASLAKTLAKMYATWSLAGMNLVAPSSPRRRPFARSTNTTWVLPDNLGFLCFLLINAVGLTWGLQDITSILAFTRGSILPQDVKEWICKHEMKLRAKDIGMDKDRNRAPG